MQVQHSRYSAHIHRGGEQPVQSRQYAHCAMCIAQCSRVLKACTMSSECPAVQCSVATAISAGASASSSTRLLVHIPFYPPSAQSSPAAITYFISHSLEKRGAGLKGGETCLGKGTKRRKKYRILTYLPETTYHRSLGQLRPLFEGFVFCYPR